MSYSRIRQIILLISLSTIAWLTMMLVHELGHVLGALFTGGHVQRVIWYPTVFSRTDVNPNPSPLLVAWAGPVFGAVMPAILAAVIGLRRGGVWYFISFIAGFCLLANGLYVGTGVFSPVGDTKEMLRLGSARISLLAFGIAAVVTGLWLWNRISPQLGFGRDPRAIASRQVYIAMTIGAVLVLLGFLFGHRGI